MIWPFVDVPSLKPFRVLPAIVEKDFRLPDTCFDLHEYSKEKPGSGGFGLYPDGLAVTLSYELPGHVSVKVLLPHTSLVMYITELDY